LTLPEHPRVATQWRGSGALAQPKTFTESGWLSAFRSIFYGVIMMTSKFKLKSIKALNEYKKERREDIDNKVCRVLYARVKAKVGNADLNQAAPALIGHTVCQRSLKERRLPPLKALMCASDKIDAQVVLRLKRLRNVGPNYPFYLELGRKFKRQHLVSMMKTLYFGYEAGCAPQELRKYQEKKLRDISRSGGRVYWDNLIGFFAACGYRMEVWLIDSTPAGNDRLMERPNYPD
jgi:hypothetical protein